MSLRPRKFGLQFVAQIEQQVPVPIVAVVLEKDFCDAVAVVVTDIRTASSRSSALSQANPWVASTLANVTYWS